MGIPGEASCKPPHEGLHVKRHYPHQAAEETNYLQQQQIKEIIQWSIWQLGKKFQRNQPLLFE